MNEENKKCPNCGADNKITASFCANCGTNIKFEEPKEKLTFEEEKEVVQEETQEEPLEETQEIVQDEVHEEIQEEQPEVEQEPEATPVEVSEEPQEEPKKVKYCSQCGKENNPDANVCRHCGNRFADAKIPINYQPPQYYSKPKKKKKGLVIGLLSLILILGIAAVLFFFVFSKHGDGRRTILLYMVGSDLETKSNAASIDLEEIKQANVNLDDTRIIVYTGGSKEWYGDFNNNAIYELTKNGYVLVKQNPQANMAVPGTLTNIIDYVAENYGSDRYGLILWNHGGGPNIGYGLDEVYSDILSVEELVTAFKNSDYLKNHKFEFIGFDACLMASVEIAKSMSRFTDYMIASEESEPVFGWEYNFLSKVNKDMDTETLVKSVVDATYESYEQKAKKYMQKFPNTLSVLDLRYVTEVEDNLSNLIKEVDSELNVNTYSHFVSTITKATSFGYNGADNSADLIDLKEMSMELENEYGTLAKDLTKSIDKLVLYQKTNLKGANGVSIYYPYYTKKNLSAYMKIYNRLDFSSEYKKFLKSYTDILTGQKLVSKYSTLSLDYEDNSKISTTLEGELKDNFRSAGYIIFRDMSEDDPGHFMIVYNSFDTDYDATTGVLTANYNKKYVALLNDGELFSYATTKLLMKGEDGEIYGVPVVLSRGGSIGEHGIEFDNDDFDMEQESGWLLFEDDNFEGEMLSIMPIAGASDISSSRKNLNLEEWDYIQFLNFSDVPFDEEGNYVFGNVDEQYYIAKFETDENFSLKLLDLDEEHDYYCMFQIEDTQGNVYSTKFIKIE